MQRVIDTMASAIIASIRDLVWENRTQQTAYLIPEINRLLADLDIAVMKPSDKLNLPLSDFYEPVDPQELIDNLIGDSLPDHRDPDELLQELDRELDQIHEQR